MCEFNCAPFLAKCQAECCGIVPFEKKFFNANIDKVVTEPIIENFNDISPFDPEPKDYVLPMTENGSCCFLRSDYSCAIYEVRPQICRIYGDESVSTLSCHYQDKTGRKRSRQEQRFLERKSEKHMKSFIKKKA